MIYTCTMNPAIDLFVETQSYHPQVVNRSNGDDIQANGKGVNVSFILKMLGIENTAIGFSGGFTGKYIEETLKQKGIATNFVPVDGMTRINVFTHVIDQDTEYKLVNQGPEITEVQMKALLAIISQMKKGDMLCVSGSHPKGISDHLLIEISRITHEKGVKLVLDTSSKVVLDCLKYQPYCMKPNEEELASWFGKEQLTEEEYLIYGEKLIQLGAQKVLLSLGKKGALYFDQEQILHVTAPQGKVVNTACAGDTLLGSFVGSLEKGESPMDALQFGAAAGSSTAFSPGLTDFKDVSKLMKQMKRTIIKNQSLEVKEHGKI